MSREENQSIAKIIQLTATKAIILIVLFYLLSIIQKNYKSHKHNAIVNKHRENALRTFELFVKSANKDDVQTKAAILMEVTRTIFSAQQTGYLNNDQDADSNSKIIEIIKNVSSNSIS